MLSRTSVNSYLTRPIQILKTYRRADLGADLLAGVTVGVILLPQAIAFAVLANLPPAMGLYAAGIGAIIGALWGSSNQIHTGPVNTTSLLVASVLLALAPAGGPRYVLAAGLLAVMVGVFQLVLGSARLGMLVNFVAYSVITGFSTGSGILILAGQLRPLLGLPSASGDNFLQGLFHLVMQLPATHLPTAVIGFGTIALIWLIGRINRKLPGILISLVIAAGLVYLLGWQRVGVRVIGSLPRGLPPPANLTFFDLNLLIQLSTGALAVGALGLIQTAAVSRSISAATRQKPDSNQEFVGQGLANIAAGLFSGFPVSASFSRSVFNLQNGARTSLAALFSGIFVLVALLTLAPLAALLPLGAVAGVLILTSFAMIDLKTIRLLWRGSREESLIMVVTLLGTLFLRLDFAVLTGILLSFAIYIKNKSIPRVLAVVPDENYRHMTYQPGKPFCPQLAVFDILGDLYFGAVNHIEERIKRHIAQNPTQKYLLLRMQNVDNCDISGIQLLESIVEAYREKGGDIYMLRVQEGVQNLMNATGFDKVLGADHFLNADEAIHHIFYRVLDPAICIYECNVRVFRECQTLARPENMLKLPPIQVSPAAIAAIEPRELWKEMHAAHPPVVVDVREPREYRQGHIPQADLLPLPKLFEDASRLPRDQPLVLACRSGRRSLRAAQFLYDQGYRNVSILSGGLMAWEAAGLLEAIENGF